MFYFWFWILRDHLKVLEDLTVFPPDPSKGSKTLNGGSDAQDSNQPQHNGDSNEDSKDSHEASSKKKWGHVLMGGNVGFCLIFKSYSCSKVVCKGGCMLITPWILEEG